MSSSLPLLGSTDAAPIRYFETAKLNQILGNFDEALRLAERGLSIEKDCLGDDHVIYQQSSHFVRQLREGSRETQ